MNSLFCRLVAFTVLLLTSTSFFVFAQSQQSASQVLWEKDMGSRGKLVGSMQELDFEEEFKKYVQKHGTKGYDKPSRRFLFVFNLVNGKYHRLLWQKRLWWYEEYDKGREQITFLDAQYDSAKNLVLVYRQGSLVLAEVYRPSAPNGKITDWMTAKIWREFVSDSDYIKSAIIQGSLQTNNLRVLVTPMKSAPFVAHYKYDPKLKKAKWLRLPVGVNPSTHKSKTE